MSATKAKPKEPRIERAGDWLARAHDGRKRFAPLPAALMPRSADEAYAMQAEFVGAPEQFRRQS